MQAVFPYCLHHCANIKEKLKLSSTERSWKDSLSQAPSTGEEKRVGNKERTERENDNCETMCSQSAEARFFSCSLSLTQEQQGGEGEGNFTCESSNSLKFIAFIA